MTVADATALCGARKRDGAPCRREAGWGTDHPGIGQCKLHGGSMPNNRKAAARAGLAALVPADMATAVEVEPGEALIQVVWLVHGQLAFANERVRQIAADDLHDGEGRPAFWLLRQSELIERAARVSKMALDAGVAERRLRLIERMADHIAGAAEDALEGLPLSAAQRQQFVDRFVGRLAVLGAGDDDG